MNKERKRLDLLVNEFCPHAGLTAEHKMCGIGCIGKIERIAVVIFLPIAAAGDVVQIPAG